MKKFNKAYTAAGAALATGLGLALSDGALTGGEVLTAIGAALLAGAAVYKVKNAGDANA